MACSSVFPVTAVYGMHNRPGLPVGRYIIGPNARAAGGAFFDITITGKGAHGAHPHQSIDPIVVACHLGTALQSIVSRNISAQDTAVLSITRIQSGDAYNVVPQSAIMAGTVRAMKPDVMAMIEQNMKRLTVSIADGFGAEATVDFRLIFAPMVNNEAEAIAYGDAAAALVGEDNVRRDGPPGMGSEDFSFMMERVPARTSIWVMAKRRAA